MALNKVFIFTISTLISSVSLAIDKSGWSCEFRSGRTEIKKVEGKNIVEHVNFFGPLVEGCPQTATVPNYGFAGKDVAMRIAVNINYAGTKSKKQTCLYSGRNIFEATISLEALTDDKYSEEGYKFGGNDSYPGDGPRLNVTLACEKPLVGNGR